MTAPYTPSPHRLYVRTDGGNPPKPEHDWQRHRRDGYLDPPAYEREGALSLGLASIGLLAMVLLAGLLTP